MPKKKNPNTYWKRLKIRYKLSIFNEGSLEEMWHIHLSRLNGYLALTALIIILVSGITFIIVATPLKTLLPGYLKRETRTRLVDNALQIDSLREVLDKNERYLFNLRTILSGAIPIDSMKVTDSLFVFPSDSLFPTTQATQEFMQRYEEEEKYNLSLFSNTQQTDGYIFSVPARGEIDQSFDPAKRFYGVTLLSPKRSNIVSVLDGTIISIQETDSQGYVLVVQHSGGFLSLYLYASEVLKKTGDRVSAGEAIALTGAGTDPQKPLFEFQLWNKGTALNPTEYIPF